MSMRKILIPLGVVLVWFVQSFVLVELSRPAILLAMTSLYGTPPVVLSDPTTDVSATASDRLSHQRIVELPKTPTLQPTEPIKQEAGTGSPVDGTSVSNWLLLVVFLLSPFVSLFLWGWPMIVARHYWWEGHDPPVKRW